MTSSYDSALVDVAMIEDPRLLALERGARLLHLEALVWSKAHLTDGFIPARAIARLTDEPDPRQAAGALVDAGLWTMTDAGWRLIDFLETQMSAARVRAKRQSSRERYDRWQASQETKRVGGATANDSARPAPPARKGGGQVGGNGAELVELAPASEKRDAMTQRRTLAKAIREAPESLRERHLRSFEERYPQYPAEHRGRRNRRVMHRSIAPIIRAQEGVPA
jgi:hypothetical protein